MKLIKQLQQIHSLDLPAGIKEALIYHLTEPFNFDINVAQAVWDELDTSLYCVESADTDSSLAHEDDVTQSALQFLNDYPEFIDAIKSEGDEDYLLALAIFTSDGGGSYLLAPMDSELQIIIELKTQLQSQPNP
jgi:alpha-D-ribose 1-methylphosphonate 5-triphosphate synthase subunit PhnI